MNSKTGQKFAVTRYRGQVGGRLNVTRCLPKVVIGGVQKGGSTALAAILSAHPNVEFAPHKELHYFDGGTWSEIKTRIADERGLELDAGLMRALLDWGIVVPA